jgi:beta-1,4-mannosyl-glycoprotein beta-1,4-N-acetylglucosaminyltransferase
VIYDCFIFFNELDLLDIRFEELYPVVDQFVIVESDMTFSGKPKPLYLSENLDRYDQYRDKIKIVADMDRANKKPWESEKRSRNQNAVGLSNCKPDDTILVSDADEIPRRKTVQDLAGTIVPVSLWLDKFLYGLNLLTVEKHGSTKVFPYSYLYGRTPHSIRKTDIHPYYVDAGWEFSSFGKAEDVYEKFQSFSHTEYSDIPVEVFAERIANAQDVLAREGHTLTAVELDDTWPEAVKRDLTYWKEFTWTVSD